MILGNGLIASGFFESPDDFDDCVVFACGVSNSKETNIKNFEREKKLILQTIVEHQDLTFIYFSSILADVSNNEYYNHNLEMERLIKENSSNYLIFKLPQVIGGKGNKNNLMNYLVNSIKNLETIIVYNDIDRALIDIEDVVSIVFYVKERVKNKTIHVSLIEKISVLDLCRLIGVIVNETPIIKTKEGVGYDDWFMENSGIVEDALEYYGTQKKGYTKKILKKYIK